MKSDVSLVKTLLYLFIRWKESILNNSKYSQYGLCALRNCLESYGYITFDENLRLQKILSDNKPESANKLRYWFVNRKERIDFLHDLIDKLEGVKTANPKINHKHKTISLDYDMPF